MALVLSNFYAEGCNHVLLDAVPQCQLAEKATWCMLVIVTSKAAHEKLHLLSKNEHRQGQHRLKAEVAEDKGTGEGS